MGGDGAAPRPLQGSVRRTPLARGAWVDFCPGWLAGSAEVFARLVQSVPWRAEQRRMYDRVVAVPRLLCFYGEDAPLPDPALTAARDALTAHYGPALGEPFRTAGLCLYRDGRDSVAWHGATGAGAAAAGRRYLVAVRGRARGSAGHGRQLPAHLGARRTQDGQGDRAADQRTVPSRGRALTSAA